MNIGTMLGFFFGRGYIGIILGIHSRTLPEAPVTPVSIGWFSLLTALAEAARSCVVLEQKGLGFRV